MATSDLPPEILIDIFSRLPTKSVGKCRCLAKTWRTLLSTPQFIKSHQIRKPYQQNLILLDPSRSVHSAAAVEGGVSRKLRLQHNFLEIAGSCDGLVLFVADEDRKVLVNPITLQSKEITDSPLALDKDERFNTCGLGYDEISDDYKIVELSYLDSDDEYSPDGEDTFVDVYSVRNCVWERVDNSPYDHPIDYLSFGTFVNGAIHWMARSREEGFPTVIAAFDLADEVFDEMPLPSNADLARFVHYKLDVLRGCLCVVNNGVNRCDVWIMKEYGVGKSWLKFNIGGEFQFDNDRIVWPLCFHRDDVEIIVLIDWESLAVYNVKKKAFRGMGIDGVPGLFMGGGAFVESLLSPAPLEESLTEAEPKL